MCINFGCTRVLVVNSFGDTPNLTDDNATILDENETSVLNEPGCVKQTEAVNGTGCIKINDPKAN
jgi:hypothetical protein